MLTCFTQQLLYQEEKCPFLVLPGSQSPSHLLTPFLVPFFTYFGTAEKNLQALYGVNLFFPLPKIYPGSVSTATAYTVCGRGCVCTVCMNTGVFRGTRTKCKPSAAIQQSGKLLTANRRLMPATAGGHKSLLLVEEWFQWLQPVLQTGHVQDAPVCSYSLCTSIESCQSGVGLKTW